MSHYYMEPFGFFPSFSVFICFNTYLFVYWLCWVLVAAHGLSLLENRGYSLVVVQQLLIASPVAEQTLEHGLQQLCLLARGVFWEQGWNTDSYPLDHQGSPQFSYCALWDLRK